MLLAAPRTALPASDDRPALDWPQKVDLFGIGISPTSYDQAVELILDAALRREPAVVACQAVHAVMTACGDRALKQRVNQFEMLTPDGQPVRWAMNLLHGTRLKERVYGPELMLRLCRGAAERGISIYLYGGSPEVLARLQPALLKQCPGLQIAGAESPPFRSLSPEEDREVVERIDASGAGLVFIGLGCPKQDHFAFEHRESIRAVQLCVGAAFDFHAGAKPMAPEWMQRRGLEWLFRLYHEPRRLWRRYLTTNSLFVAKLTAAWLRQVFRIQPAPKQEKRHAG